MDRERNEVGGCQEDYPLLLDVLAEFFDPGLELLAGLQKVVGVVNNMRGHK